MLCVLLVGFVGAGMTGACGASEPSDSGCPAPGVDAPAEQPTDCAEPMPGACMLYRIPLIGSPSTDVALRAKYIAAFGSACYVSDSVDNPTFGCFYKTWQNACADAVNIAKVFGADPYKEGYMCQAVGNGDYRLQVGPDVSNTITIYYEAAPRQTPLIEIKSVPTEVSGPYRDLTEPQQLGPDLDFHCAKVDNVEQWVRILQVNRKAHGGQVHSDLAGFEYPCGVDENCKPKTCTEPLVLKDPADKRTLPNDPDRAQVHHVVPRKDKRSCPWGTNSNKNAAVISGRLNRHLFNKVPPENEVLQINKIPAYTP